MNESTQKILFIGESWLPKIIQAGLVIVISIIAAFLIKKIILSTCKKFDFDQNHTVLFSRSSNIGIIMLGTITALGTLGINVSALVAGLGLTGFALGYALKDTISNFLSGVLILLYRPFSIGDRIRIGDHEGVVLAIDFRYTELNSEHTNVLIPNSKLFIDPIVVFDKKESIIDNKK